MILDPDKCLEVRKAGKRDPEAYFKRVVREGLVE